MHIPKQIFNIKEVILKNSTVHHITCTSLNPYCDENHAISLSLPQYARICCTLFLPLLSYDHFLHSDQCNQWKIACFCATHSPSNILNFNNTVCYS